MTEDPTSLLRPPREPIPLPDPWAWVPWVVWALIGLLTLVLIVRWWIRRSRIPPPPPPPIVVAKRLLASLSETTPPAEAAVVTAVALRQYCTARYGLPATGQTSEELLASLRGHPSLTPAATSSLLAFLEQRDVVAFAGVAAGPGATIELRDRALAFLNAAEVPIEPLSPPTATDAPQPPASSAPQPPQQPAAADTPAAS